MAMGIFRQGSLSGGELGREIPSAVRGTVQLPFFIWHYQKAALAVQNCLNGLPYSEFFCPVF
ncbi:hypothetical protein HanRHA438_Chr06g0283031 [Helianthus annuus]|uniref:Uncharacterized protein n=1 Tax=Helianthus annuus TaxID=4232 RepID=A0A9K3IVP7_HELAN|nr:hypothetical protein HanXRQr2_Chr06g0273961 [Helianthus annuus]KAJ0568292.1 hypothetical protein HanIR_Chr06g0294541 [Helianthus annuus]KAJ0913211.1 hypothetical protein HanRHA438_Chr06g0283031 [Helianthus annuus]KAJ0916685.1 hypothetical protein HanPSC8_Chr06g0264631 [Helianthus annuus]